MRSWFCSLMLLLFVTAPSDAADQPTYSLAAELAEGDTTAVSVSLEVGGDLLVTEETGTKPLPLTVAGKLRYVEQIVSWSTEDSLAARSLRQYEHASAKIQVDDGGLSRELPEEKRQVVAEIQAAGRVALAAKTPLTREQFDLVNVVGNSLALNRLLPGRALAEGEGWDHDAATMQALLGMDHVAVCEVRSVVTGSEHRQVQIRMSGTVHGTIDGAPTEMELRGAYLFHEEQKRISKMNLAIKESRTAGQIVPGLDVVAKISIEVTPTQEKLPESFKTQALEPSLALANSLRYEVPKRGYQFLHGHAWYVTAEQSDMVSLRALQDGNLTAHCNITPLPARSEGRETSLEEYERDVRQALGDNLATVNASTEWMTGQGHRCYGVVAQGKVQGVPIEWRYYLIASPGLPRVSLAVTIEQSQLKAFDDADRQIVDTLELLEKPAVATAAKPTKQVAQ